MKFKPFNWVMYFLIGFLFWLYLSNGGEAPSPTPPQKNLVSFNEYFETVVQEDLPDKYKEVHLGFSRACSGPVIKLPKGVEVYLSRRGDALFGIEQVRFPAQASGEDKKEAGKLLCEIIETLKRLHINAFEQEPDSFTIHFNRAYIDEKTIPILNDPVGGPFRAQCLHFVRNEDLKQFLKNHPQTYRLNEQWFCGLY